MKLSELVSQYVSYKRALGMRFDSEAATLAAFCRRLDGNIDVLSVTVEQVQDFLTGNRPLTNHWSKRKSVLDCLFRFALSRGHTTVSPFRATVQNCHRLWHLISIRKTNLSACLTSQQLPAIRASSWRHMFCAHLS